MTKHLAIAFVIFLLSLITSAPLSAAPKINWTPKKLSVEHEQGVTYQHQISFSSLVDMEDVYLSVVPELADLVTVSKNKLGAIRRGDSTTLTLTLSIPRYAEPGLYEGVLQVRSQLVQGTLSKPLPIKINIVEKQVPVLPPDPGEAGKQSVLGADIDNDGVRDDVQRFIVLTYSDNTLLQKALFEIAKHYQNTMQIENDKDVARDEYERFRKHYQCLNAVINNAYEYRRELKARFFNTFERSERHLKFHNLLVGYVSGGLPPKHEWRANCAFDSHSV